MKLIKRILLIVFISLTLLVVAVTAFIKHIAGKGLPDYNKDIRLDGLTANVEVIRDQYGIPHITAETENDLYTATGYLLAQDRLWQMDLLRRVTLGRLSEIFGEEFVETDLFLRALRYSDKSQKLLQQDEPEIIRVLEAFAMGVNQYIAHSRRKLPLEFTLLGYKPEPWEPFHSLNLIGYMAWDLKSGWSEYIIHEIARELDEAYLHDIIPVLSTETPSVFSSLNVNGGFDQLTEVSAKLANLAPEVFNASNNWAVAPSRTTNGKAFMANDMHLSLNLPGIWYQIHQTVKGSVNVSGLLLPGQPFIICGHNDSIAWGMTNVYVDNVDFYLEKINPADSNQYEYKDSWQNFDISRETIRVKGGDMKEGLIRFTHRGPVISGFKNTGSDILSMQWAGDGTGNEMKTIFLLNRAANWQQFREAASHFKAVSQNIVYADAAGNIGLQCAAGVPVRKRDILFGILPGWSGEYDWQGFLPFDMLPYSYNPENGVVVSANNAPVGDSYPYHIGIWYAAPYRFNRIKELLDREDLLTIDDMAAIQKDEKSLMAVQFLPRIVYGIQQIKGMNRQERVALDKLTAWDGVMSKGSVAATIFDFMMVQLIYELFADELDEELFGRFVQVNDISRQAVHRILSNGTSVWVDDINTPAKETLDDIIIRAFQKALATIEAKKGDDMANWQWGKIQQLTLEHPLATVKLLDKVFRLNRGPVVPGGSYHTIPQFNYMNTKTGIIHHGVSHRHIFVPGSWDTSLTIIPTGTSGHPSSAHYADQTNLFIGGGYHAHDFSPAAAENASRYRMQFLIDK